MLPAGRAPSQSGPPEARRIRRAWKLDSALGPCVVRCCGFARRAGHAFGVARQSSPDVRRILFIKLWGLGSLVLAEPALRQLKAAYPDADIDVVTLGGSRDVTGLMPAVSRVHALSFESLPTFLREAMQTLRTLRATGYDLVVDAEFLVNITAVMAWAVGGRVVGFAGGNSAKRWLQDVSVPLDGREHIAAAFGRLAAAAGAARASGRWPALTRPALTAGTGFIDPARRQLFRPLAQRYVAINVNAGPLALERRWPADRFATLARTLLERYRVDVVLCGLPGEADRVADVERAIGSRARVWNLCGRLNQLDLAAVLSGASLLISNDSGPVHMAAALGTPVAAFYGPETPLRYGPLVARALVFYTHEPCSPCMDPAEGKVVKCTSGGVCLTSIDAESAAVRVMRFIDQHGLLPSVPTPTSERHPVAVHAC